MTSPSPSKTSVSTSPASTLSTATGSTDTTPSTRRSSTASCRSGKGNSGGAPRIQIVVPKRGVQTSTTKTTLPLPPPPMSTPNVRTETKNKLQQHDSTMKTPPLAQMKKSHNQLHQPKDPLREEREFVLNALQQQQQPPQGSRSGGTIGSGRGSGSGGGLDFPINEDCTSLCIHPSGRFMFGGFSDGTLRVFEMAGKQVRNLKRRTTTSPKDDDAANEGEDDEANEDDDAEVDDDDDSDENEAELDFDDDDDGDMKGGGANEDVASTTTTTTTSSSSSSSSPASSTSQQRKRSKGTTRLVSSSHFQRFGAVACQIVAKGVHKNLLMHVECSQDGLYCFAGVPRGSMELYAVYLGDLITNFGGLEQQPPNESSSLYNESSSPSSGYSNKNNNLLDHLRVHVHSDGKLKGFGGCTRVLPQKRKDGGKQDTKNKINGGGRPKYLLLTGIGIKNIHIWSFEPPIYDKGTGSIELKPEKWQQLYDTAANGVSINLLSFVYSRADNNKLFAVSKSDQQRLRMWDLSMEQQQLEQDQEDGDSNKENNELRRPKRPPFTDILNTEASLAIAGNSFSVCGGNGIFNKMSIVRLDQSCQYNHTELGLPVAGNASSENSSSSSTSTTTTPVRSTSMDTTASTNSRRRRPQRGDLKQIVGVASMKTSASHILLELDDGALVLYKSHKSGAASLDGDKNIIPRLEVVPVSAGIPPKPEFYRRTICIGSLYDQVIVAFASIYNPNTGKGSISVRALEWIDNTKEGKTSSSSSSPQTTDQRAIQDCVQAPPASAFVSRCGKRKPEEETTKDDASKKKNKIEGGDRPLSRIESSSSKKGKDTGTTRERPFLKPASVQLFSNVKSTSSSSSSLLVTPQTQPQFKKKTKPISSNTKNDAMVNGSAARSLTKPSSGGGLSVTTVSPEQQQQTSTDETSSNDSTKSARKMEKKSTLVSSKKDKSNRNQSKEIATPVSSKRKASDEKTVDKAESLSVRLKKVASIPIKKTPPVSTTNLGIPNKKVLSSTTQNRNAQAAMDSPPVPRKKNLGSSRSDVAISKFSGDTNKAQPKPKLDEPTNPKESHYSKSIAKKGEQDVATQQRAAPTDVKPKTQDNVAKLTATKAPSESLPVTERSLQRADTAKSNQTSSLPNGEDKKGKSERGDEVATTKSHRRKDGRDNDELVSAGDKKSNGLDGTSVAAGKEVASKPSLGSTPDKKPTRNAALHDIANALCLLKSPKSDTPKIKRGKQSTTSPKRPTTPGEGNNRTPKRKASSRAADIDHLESLHRQYKKLKILLEGLPRSGLFGKQELDADISTDNLEGRQEAARIKMSARHRAEHELFRKQVLRATERSLRGLIFLDSSVPQTVDETKVMLKDDLQGYREILFDTLRRQEMESCALAAQHTSQLGGVEAESVSVTYPFTSTSFNVVDEFLDLLSATPRGSRSATAAAISKRETLGFVA